MASTDGEIMQDSPGNESESRQIWAKLTVATVIPLSAALYTVLDVNLAGVFIGEASRSYLAKSFVGGVLLIGLISFGFGALARRHKKSRFWPTAAWVSVVFSVMVILGELFSSSPA